MMNEGEKIKYIYLEEGFWPGGAGGRLWFS